MPEDSPAAQTHPPASGGRVLVYGEVLFDHFPDGTRVLGGAPFNVAWHLCGLGHTPLLVSAVGRDHEGHEVLDRMEGWGLSTDGVAVAPDHPTGRVEVTDAEEGPSYLIPPDQAWDHIPTGEAHGPLADEEVSLLYHGTLALRSPTSARALQEIRAQVDAPVFVDVNLRDPWWTPETATDALDGAHWAKVSEDELVALSGAEGSGDTDVERLAVTLRNRHGLHRLLVTQGARGAFLVLDDGEILRAPAPEVADLTDTVGTGDAFCAVACLGVIRGWSDRVILERAVAFAAEVCRIPGATLTDLSTYDGHLRHWAEMPWRETPGTVHGHQLYILSLSVHGLLRSTDMELGRDADTGGQIGYVVDQAKALVSHPDVARVDLVTREISDGKVDDDYARPTEEIAPGARIVRLPFGPRRYLHKESLWPYLDTLLDQLIHYVRGQDRLPDIIHSHYADAGYVGAQLSKLLGIPFVFTGHSLGRIKRRRLLDDGQREETIEKRYRITRRIEAEEQALEAADLVIASTHDEVTTQYEAYDHYLPGRMEVIPPGVDLTRFSPPSRFWLDPPIQAEVDRFLTDPSKPMILALARADERKNFPGLVRAYAGTPGLREAANLVLVAGNRDDLTAMDPAPRRVLTDILVEVDRHDLYGSVAYPKHHAPDDVPDLYRLAARSRGIFVNAALTEPFGLTLIEAAAAGLPVVVTDDGGPRDILGACRHGVLVDVLDTRALGEAMLKAVTDRPQWNRWAKNAVSRVHENFSWRSHTRRYVTAVEDVLAGNRPAVAPRHATRLPRVDRLLVTDVEGTLTGDEDALGALAERLQDAGNKVGFAVATGCTLDRAMSLLDELGLWIPDVLITGSGTEIHYGARLVRDRSWERQIRHRWDPEALLRAVAGLSGLTPVPGDTTPFRLRFALGSDAPGVPAIRTQIRQAGLLATPIVDRGETLDLVPGRASQGMAIRFLSFKWSLPPERILVAGDSGNDADMLSGETLGVVVANHTDELALLRDRPRVHFADGSHAWGILEGVEHYDFFGTIRTHDKEEE